MLKFGARRPLSAGQLADLLRRPALERRRQAQAARGRVVGRRANRPGRERMIPAEHDGRQLDAFAENEAESPFAPYHVEKGFAATRVEDIAVGPDELQRGRHGGLRRGRALLRG